MESVGSSPSYTKTKSRFGAKKENSPDGSECDDNVSIASSTGKSAIGSTYEPKLKNTGTKYRSNNKKNFVSVRSFRRRAKTKSIQSAAAAESDDAASASSPHYLKATSSSEGKKMQSHLSPQHSESPLSSSDRNSSPFSQSKNQKPLLTLSRTSSIRNMRFLVRKTSFKPRRTALNYSKVSDDVSVDRATYSSTIKDSKFPKPVEIHHGVTDSGKLLALRVCRYHHCSLHGHCHGGHDPAPQPKRLLYRKRWSLKKQRSMKPKTESYPVTKKSGNRKKVEPLDQESISNGVDLSGVENKNTVDSPTATYCKPETELFRDGYENTHVLNLFEVAFGETSFPERSYQDNQSILKKYSFEEENFGGTSFGPNGLCLRCSCHNKGQAMSPPRRADANLSMFKSTSSVHDSADVLGTNADLSMFKSSSSVHDNADVLGISSSFDEPKEQVSDHIEDNTSNEDHLATPVTVEVTESNSLSYSPSDSQTSSHVNSDKEGDVKTESARDGDSKFDEAMQESVTDYPPRSGSKLQFSKKRHISMWHLIHQHMSSNKGAEPQEKPLQEADSESATDDSHVETRNAEPEIQDIELRKLFAIKLVREAIEKILLPEVQDQASDDQSITSESTPRTELVEKNQSQVFKQESYGDNDADIGKANMSSNLMEEISATDETLGLEIKETETKVVSKSEKKAPKHWSNLKKWILLQRFIGALEKVRKFNPRKPQHLPFNPDPEAEKVNLRPQMVDERKNAEEWMLDFALRQAVSQLAPTQKKKVALLVKAFETVVPPQEDVHFKIPRLKGDVLDISGTSENGKPSSTAHSSVLDDNRKSGALDAANPEKIVVNGTGKNAMSKLQDLQEPAAFDCRNEDNVQVDRKNHIKMWHMIYQHVVSGIAEKVGSRLLGEAEDDGGEENKSPAMNSGDESSNVSSGFTKSYALKLIKDAVDEILLPDIQDDSDTQSVTTESVTDPDIFQRNFSGIEGQSQSTADEIVMNEAESQIKRKIEVSKSKNWSKVKKLMLLKRSIKALEKARDLKTKTRELLAQIPNPEPQKIELRKQMMDERKKAEQWMLDYTVQHIVTKLTPARKRRVSMLVEAFEAVVPLPDA